MLKKAPTDLLQQFIPILGWIKSYKSQLFHSDIFAGIITAILLIPQGIAYAFLAGLPAEVGIYSSLLPALVYVVLGSSRVLSVGPVSIAAIMVASALSSADLLSMGTPTQNAMILAVEGGVILCLMSLLRMGSLVNYISHPVLTGFTSGAAIIIVFSQLPKMLGIDASSCKSLSTCLFDSTIQYNFYIMGLGLLAIVILILMGTPLITLLKKLQVKKSFVTAITKSAPLLTIIIGTILVTHYSLNENQGVSIVGSIPQGFPSFSFEFLNVSLDHMLTLLPSAFFISLIAYVESVAIAKYIASVRNEKLDTNQELVGIGMANIASSVTGGMPVAGGFSRTMVNYTAGAQTQIAMLIAVIVLSTLLYSVSQAIESIPKAVLAAIIIIAVFPLIKVKNLITTWKLDKSDGISQIITLLGVLVLGIEEGIILGVVVTILSYIRRTGNPHIAVVGKIKDTEHFRNIKRHTVQTWDGLLLIRIDENITFANINYISEFIEEQYRLHTPHNIVLIFSSVSYIDTTAVVYLRQLIANLKNHGVTVDLAEVKGPVLDIFEKVDFLKELSPGKIFIHTSAAVENYVKAID
jgi:SulP family sulfate permease